jgi:REP element-mobilizing transposase RayT
LPGHDYSGPGIYFVTLCVDQGVCLFGDIFEDRMVLSEFGNIADEEWRASEELRSEVELDEYVVMPNHLHGLVVFRPDDSGSGRPPSSAATALENRPKRSLGSLIAGYKTSVTTRINRLQESPGERVWQRNYWEHIVRTDQALDAIRSYIRDNPARWSLDRYHPNPSGVDPQAREVWRLLRESK